MIEQPAYYHFLLLQVDSPSYCVDCDLYIDACLDVEVSLSEGLALAQESVLADVRFHEFRINVGHMHPILLDFTPQGFEEASDTKLGSAVESPVAGPNEPRNRNDIDELSLAGNETWQEGFRHCYV